jgi:acetyltransferase-like isoleucine patch superfamily enzyme
MYFIAVIFFGIALSVGIFVVLRVWAYTYAFSLALRCVFLGMSIAAGYFLFGFTLIFLAGGIRSLFRIRLKEGSHNMFSFQTLEWAFISALDLMIKFTFSDFILLTPFAGIYFKMMGAKIGKNVQINSKFVFDATLLEIGDNTVIGGNATVISHVVEWGVLKLKKVKIGKNVTIGSNAVVMPGVEIGDNALIGVGAVLLKNTRVAPRSVWYGIPAAPIKPQSRKYKEAAG